MTSNNETVSRQIPWAGNIAKTMTSNGKQFTVTREMLTAVAGISARYSKFTFVLFCYITNHLMTGPLGNSEFCFPRISMFPSTSSRETLRFSGNKIHCSPRDQSLSVYYSMSPRWIWSDKITNERVARVGYNHFISRDHDLREPIPHTWASSNDNLFQSNFSAWSGREAILGTTPDWPT